MNTNEMEDVIEFFPRIHTDERGSSISVFDRNKFQEITGIDFQLDQEYVAHNLHARTIRGIHYQKFIQQAKIVRCEPDSSLGIFIVIIDLREYEWQTFLKVYSKALIPGSLIYVPKGCAFGYQTLDDNTTVRYLIEGSYEKNYACGIRYNDPFFNIQWPFAPSVISKQDLNWEDYKIKI